MPLLTPDDVDVEITKDSEFDTCGVSSPLLLLAEDEDDDDEEEEEEEDAAEEAVAVAVDGAEESFNALRRAKKNS